MTFFYFKILFLNYTHLYLECDVGQFGYNCNETCGHCFDPKQCSKKNGFCVTGCRAGFSGLLCKKGVCPFNWNISFCSNIRQSTEIDNFFIVV